MNCSPYLNRPVRSLEEVLAQRKEPQARLAEAHAGVERAETELRKIGDEFSLASGVADCAYTAADMLGEFQHDYLKPVDEELKWAEEAEDEG